MIEKKPFVSYDPDREGKVLRSSTKTIRENTEDTERLERLKMLFDTKSDGETYKIAVAFTLNVLHRTFGEAFTRRLFKKERLRLSDFRSFDQ